MYTRPVEARCELVSCNGLLSGVTAATSAALFALLLAPRPNVEVVAPFTNEARLRLKDATAREDDLSSGSEVSIDVFRENRCSLGRNAVLPESNDR